MNEIDADLRVDIPPCCLVWSWSVFMATLWLMDLYSRVSLDAALRSSSDFQPNLDIIEDTLDFRRKSLQTNLAARR